MWDAALRTLERNLDRLSRALKVEYYSFWRRRAIKHGTVLLESFSGNGMVCNPEAMFQEILRADDLKGLRFTWVLAGKASNNDAKRRKTYRRVRYVRAESYAYYRALATCEFLINNATFPPQFSKRRGQVYLNTWHGTPVKKMGYHVPRGGPLTRNIIRNFLQADFIVSASEFMTETIYLDGYKLRNIYRGQFIEEGFPRIDHQFETYHPPAEALDRLKDTGIDPSGRTIVLYAPTWRGSFYAPTNETDRLARLVERLEAVLDPTKYCILLKVHQIVYDQARADPHLGGRLVPNDIPTNLMLSATDVLVTDYSSIFFDFLVTGRPIVFYATDQSEYTKSRGLYMSPHELPGPVTGSVKKLANLIENAAHQGVAAFGADVVSRYEGCTRRYCPWDDGGASRRVVDIVFRGARDGYRLRNAPCDGREKILIYPGGMRSNGITSSALNLLNAIDHSRYDVSVFYAVPKSSDTEGNEARIPADARLFPRVGGMNGSKLWRRHRRLLFDGTRRNRRRINRAGLLRLFQDEWFRCFGAAEFDYIIDFSGYGPMWPNVLLAGRAKTHTIWLHNDLAADALRETEGKRKLEGGLRAVFETYAQFDRLVSVSPALAEVNATKLARYAPRARFVSAMNIIGDRRVRTLGHGAARDGKSGSIVVPRNDVVSAVERLFAEYAPGEVAQEVERRILAASFVERDPSVVTFVCVGRLSPEKNHSRLLRAFRKVIGEHPQARLVILGSGPLFDDLTSLADSLGLGDRVRFAGHLPNPFAVMAAADCFVMSSDYEGQPMALLEARTLGLPVVATDFDTARDALPEGAGLVVERSVDGLAKGMIEFIEKGVPVVAFDPDKYNQDAVRQFLAAIGAEERSSQ